MAENYEIWGLRKEETIESMFIKILTMHIIQYRTYNTEKRKPINKNLFVQKVFFFSSDSAYECHFDTLDSGLSLGNYTVQRACSINIIPL
jgi:hypothetical protein